jgi:hydroxymethylpyrimidine/phosphomethylpyrimidine kinase
MGSVVPDRFFWALPPAQDNAEGEPPAGVGEEPSAEPEGKGKPAQRRVH